METMKSEKFAKISKIIVCIALGLGFLINSLFGRIILQAFSVGAIEIFSLALSVALLISVLTVARRYISLVNLLKAVGVTVAFWFADTIIGIETYSDVATLIYQIIRPWFAAAVVLVLFLWITKCRIAKDKTLFILIGVSFGLGVIFNALEYWRSVNYSRISVNEFFAYLQLLEGSNNIYTFIAVLCFYAQILFVFFLLIKSLYLYGKEPVKKSADSEDLKETYTETAVEGETWKCMGCGKPVPIREDRCSCGYKR